MFAFHPFCKNQYLTKKPWYLQYLNSFYSHWKQLVLALGAGGHPRRAQEHRVLCQVLQGSEQQGFGLIVVHPPPEPEGALRVVKVKEVNNIPQRPVDRVNEVKVRKFFKLIEHDPVVLVCIQPSNHLSRSHVAVRVGVDQAEEVNSSICCFFK